MKAGRNKEMTIRNKGMTIRSKMMLVPIDTFLFRGAIKSTSQRTMVTIRSKVMAVRGKAMPRMTTRGKRRRSKADRSKSSHLLETGSSKE